MQFKIAREDWEEPYILNTKEFIYYARKLWRLRKVSINSNIPSQLYIAFAIMDLITSNNLSITVNDVTYDPPNITGEYKSE